MRVPGFILTHRVGLIPLEGTNARGSTFGAELTGKPAHVEERAALKLDERADSDTRGTVITMSVQVITQLENYLPPGSRITWNGRTLTVANARRYEHPRAPSNAEMWCV